MPSKLKRAPSPCAASDDEASNLITETVSMTARSEATGAIPDKSFRHTQHVPETMSNRSLKLSDILKPTANEVGDKKIPSHDIAGGGGNNNAHVASVNTKVAIGADGDNGDYESDKTSLDVLKDLEKRLSRMEQSALLKAEQTSAERNGADINRKLIKIKNQYADRENLTRAGIESSTESTLGPGNESDADSNENIYFVRGGNARSSIAVAGSPKTRPSKQSGPGSAPSKPVARALSDTKAAENSVHKIRFNYLQKKMGQDQTRKLPLQSKIDCSSHATDPVHAAGPLSPLSHKKKENVAAVDQANASRPVDKHANFSHVASSKRDALRHPITPTQQAAKLNKRDYQVKVSRVEDFHAISMRDANHWPIPCTPFAIENNRREIATFVIGENECKRLKAFPSAWKELVFSQALCGHFVLSSGRSKQWQTINNFQLLASHRID